MNVAKRLLLCTAMLVVLAGIAGAGDDAAAAGQPDVWWGNRDVSFGNYIKSDDPVIPPKKEKAVRADFEPIYFDLDKADLKPQGIRVAERAAKWLKKHPDACVTIEGHCCDLASDDYNIGLGQRRADAVQAFLIKEGIDSSRIRTVSYGEQRLAAGTDHREKNRRAVLVIEPRQ